jgi:threonine/homoserine/homoserine lactone efflux protein
MSFVPELSVLIPFLIATVVISITPGPDMALFLGRALTQGRAAGLACVAGSSTGCVLHSAFAALGLSALIVASQPAFLALKIVGAVYLVWLAWQALRHGSGFSPNDKAGGRPVSMFRNWATATMVDLTNPKVVLFYMTFLPQFVSASDPHAIGKLFFLGMLIVAVTIPVNVGLVLTAHRLAGLLQRNPRITRVVDYLFAGVFAAFAVRILATRNG